MRFKSKIKEITETGRIMYARDMAIGQIGRVVSDKYSGELIVAAESFSKGDDDYYVFVSLTDPSTYWIYNSDIIDKFTLKVMLVEKVEITYTKSECGIFFGRKKNSYCNKLQYIPIQQIP